MLASPQGCDNTMHYYVSYNNNNITFDIAYFFEKI